jgi:tetratricopeptide (TPR) repeat protein
MILPEATGDDPAYIFKHALGQQAVYELMTFAQRREWHAAVAGHYELQDERREAQHAVLAHHWSLAEQPGRAFGCLRAAAEQALARYACREAVRFYERAIALREADPSLASSHEIAVLEEGLSRALYGHGDAERTRLRSERALALFGRPVARSGLWLLLGLLGGVLRAVHQARRPERYEVKTEREREAALLSARMQSTLAEIAVFREDAAQCLYSAMRQLIEARRLGPSPDLARAYAILSNMLAVIPMRKTCAAWTRRSVEMVDELGSRIDRAWVYSRAAAYTGVTVQWHESHRLNAEASAIAEEIGDRRLYEESEASRGVFLAIRGCNHRSLPALDNCIRSAQASGNDQSEAWSSLTRAEVLMRMGEADRALEDCDRLRPWLDSDQAMTGERAMGLGAHSLARALTGQMEAALQDADVVRRTFLATRPVGYWTCHVAPEVAQVWLLALKQGQVDRGEALRWCRLAVKHMWVASKLFLFCEPMALDWQGRVQLLEGKTDRAIASWRKGLVIGQERGCERELALCRSLLGRHLPEGQERERQAAEGRRMLEEAGAKGDMALVE